MSVSFHEVRFPSAISYGATGGPERRTEIVVLGSGYEERNSRWAHSRRRYNAGYGIKSIGDLHEVIAFFEERRGRLHGFRWKDHADYRSCPSQRAPAPADQQIGIGDGTTNSFQLVKTYGAGETAYRRTVRKPVAGTVAVTVDAVLQSENADYAVDAATGVVVFLTGRIPAAGAVIAAGFEFDTPVRFDTDFLEINLTSVSAGQIPDIPVIEVRL
jgi:uncharacterized protein (TIGR02217 family)